MLKRPTAAHTVTLLGPCRVSVGVALTVMNAVFVRLRLQAPPAVALSETLKPPPEDEGQPASGLLQVTWTAPEVTISPQQQQGRQQQYQQECCKSVMFCCWLQGRKHHAEHS